MSHVIKKQVKFVNTLDYELSIYDIQTMSYDKETDIYTLTKNSKKIVDIPAKLNCTRKSKIFEQMNKYGYKKYFRISYADKWDNTWYNEVPIFDEYIEPLLNISKIPEQKDGVVYIVSYDIFKFFSNVIGSRQDIVYPCGKICDQNNQLVKNTFCGFVSIYC